MVKGKIFTIKEGKLQKWLDWCAKLDNELRDEAAVMLEEECLAQEICVVYSHNGEHYVVGLVEELREEHGSTREREINKRHNALKDECLEEVSTAKHAYHIKV